MNPQITPGSAGTSNIFASSVTAASNASPIIVTFNNFPYYTLQNNDVINITGVAGNIGANGEWIASAVSVGGSTTSVTLINSSGTGAYTSGGTVTVEVLELINAAWVQGWGNGFWATNGGGLKLSLSPGGSFISGSVVNYAGGSLTLSDNSTNYAYLDSSTGIPSSNTTGYTTSTIPISTVVTSGGGITSITDNRTMFFSGGGSSSNGTALLQTITQTAHGFGSAGAFVAVYYTGSAWALAKADSQNTLGIGIALVIDADHFYLYTEGLITGLTGLSSGEYYFVSDATAGLLTVTEPTLSSSFSNPLLQATSTTQGQVCEFRPSEILPVTPQPVPQLVRATAGPVADPTGNDYYLYNDYGAITFTAPSAHIVGTQRIYANYVSITGAITVQISGTDKVALFGVNGSAGGTLASGGAAGDAVGLVCDSSGHWTAFVISGTWSVT